MGSESSDDRSNADYLAQLLSDKRQMQPFAANFLHIERVLDEEISRVRQSLFHSNTNPEPLELPDQLGPVVVLTEKLYVPAKDYPDFNFVGRILGPRGMTAKQLEQETGCKIMVRGKGSTRDKRKEDLNRTKSNWEHLSDELHVLITVEDSKNRAVVKLKRAVDEVKKLLVPSPEGEDDLKKLQLMELAIINGTYRDSKPSLMSTCSQPGTMMSPGLVMSPAFMMPPPHLLRSPGPAGAPIILAPPRMQPIYTNSSLQSPSVGLQMTAGGPPPLVSPGDPQGTVFYQFDQYFHAVPSPVFDFPHQHNALDHHVSVSMPYVR